MAAKAIQAVFDMAVNANGVPQLISGIDGSIKRLSFNRSIFREFQPGGSIVKAKLLGLFLPLLLVITPVFSGERLPLSMAVRAPRSRLTCFRNTETGRSSELRGVLIKLLIFGVRRTAIKKNFQHIAGNLLSATKMRWTPTSRSWSFTLRFSTDISEKWAVT